MRIVEINMVDYGSTGRIMLGIAATCNAAQIECYSFSINVGNLSGVATHKYFSSMFEHKVDYGMSLLFGSDGFHSMIPTRGLLKQIDAIAPDIIHLHNLHGSYINIPMLFHYCISKKVRIVWTLHDCWSFTGRCPHFQITACEKWKTGCGKCRYPRQSYPQCLFDHSRRMWLKKKRILTAPKDLMIVTPSNWLAGLVKESFLGKYPVTVIPNGIDLSVFKPLPSEFRKKSGIPDDKFLLLGVAFDWGIRKGLDVFIELAGRLPQERYQIVLVGTNEKLDRQLPPGILSIHRTQNQTELTEIYTAADLFVNPTREDTYPTVNMEALACGTPVLTFRTGGSPETLDESCGSVVACGDVDALENEIIHICEEKPFTKEACLKRAVQFDMNERFREYVELYQKGLWDENSSCE